MNKIRASSIAFGLICLLTIIEARYTKLNVNLALTVAEDEHRLSEDMVRICAQETDISMEELHKFRHNDFTNSSESTQCFAHCIYEQMGLMRDGIFVRRDFISAIADMSDPNTLASDCHALKGENKCETAFRIYQCKQESRSRKQTKDDEDDDNDGKDINSDALASNVAKNEVTA